VARRSGILLALLVALALGLALPASARGAKAGPDACRLTPSGGAPASPASIDPLGNESEEIAEEEEERLAQPLAPAARSMARTAQIVRGPFASGPEARSSKGRLSGRPRAPPVRG